MAMTPEERREFEELKRIVRELQSVTNVSFIEEGKRRIVTPEIKRLGVDAVISKQGAGSTAGITQSVNEAGAGSYSVADVYDGSITIVDVNGTAYKLGYYNP